jgi:hypothetical protein
VTEEQEQQVLRGITKLMYVTGVKPLSISQDIARDIEWGANGLLMQKTRGWMDQYDYDCAMRVIKETE